MLRFISFLLLLSFFGCNTPMEGNHVVIEGHVEGSMSSTISYGVWGGKVNVAQVDQNGYFEMNFYFKSDDCTAFIAYDNGREPQQINLFLEKGYELQLTFDGDHFMKTAHFEGFGGTENNYLAKKLYLEHQLGVETYELFRLSKDDFIKAINIHFEELFYFIDFTRMNTPGFWRNARVEAESRRINLLIQYAYYFELLHNETKENLGEEYFDFLKDVDFNDEEKLFSCPEYEEFIWNYIKYKATRQNISDRNNYVRMFELIPAILTNSVVKNHFQYRTLIEAIESNNTSQIGKTYSLFVRQCSDSTYIKIAEEAMAKWRETAEGIRAPVFTGKTLQGERVSLTNFRGRYVYLFIWASWCTPCVDVLPDFYKYANMPHVHDVVFIGFSVDEDIDVWKKEIDKYGMGPIQLISEEGLSADIIDQYTIHSLPACILIDHEGRILQMNAPLPEKELLEVFRLFGKRL